MKAGLQLVSVWFGVVMVLLMLAGSIAFTFTGFMSDSIYGNKRIFFVLLLMAYAVYRSIRIYQVLKHSR